MTNLRETCDFWGHLLCHFTPNTIKRNTYKILGQIFNQIPSHIHWIAFCYFRSHQICASWLAQTFSVCFGKATKINWIYGGGFSSFLFVLMSLVKVLNKQFNDGHTAPKRMLPNSTENGPNLSKAFAKILFIFYFLIILVNWLQSSIML